MANPTKTETSHGQSGDSKPTPVPEHKSYGSDKRDEVAGGPAGRGNDTGATADTGRDWGTGDDREGKKKLEDKDKPVGKGSGEKNVFSPD